MLVPPASQKGWKVWTVGDDIAWMRAGPDGRLWAINPEAGFFGVAPGTSTKTNPNAMATRAREHDLHQRRGHRRRLPVVGRHRRRGAGAAHRLARPAVDARARARRRRIRTRASPRRRAQCPSISPKWDDPQGVPISAFIFGGRRARTAPLVLRGASTGTHGVFVGASVASETTAAQTGAVGVVRRDPDGDAAVLRLQHGRLLRPLAARWARTLQAAAEDLPRQLVPPGRRRASSSGPASARTCACCAGSSSAAQGTGAAVESPIGLLPATGAHRHRRARRRRRDDARAARRVDATTGGRRPTASASSSPSSAIACRPRWSGSDRRWSPGWADRRAEAAHSRSRSRRAARSSARCRPSTFGKCRSMLSRASTTAAATASRVPLEQLRRR